VKRRLVVTFLLGALTGAALVSPLSGYQVERALLEKEQLQVELENLRNRMSSLEERLSEPHYQRDVTVEDIEVVGDLPDSATRINLDKKLGEMLKTLVGREVEQIDPLLLYYVFDGRTVDLGEKPYVLQVKGIVIARRLVFFYTASEKSWAPEVQE